MRLAHLQVVYIPFKLEISLTKGDTVETTYKSQTQTSGEGRMLYLASVDNPMIHGPGSSM